MASYEEIKKKAAYWLDELKKRYDVKDILPCDFFLENLTVLDLVMIADDIELLSELITVHGSDAIRPCICESLTYIPELHKNECYKTLRAADSFSVEDCLKMKREMMNGMMSPLVDKMKKQEEQEEQEKGDSK